MISMCENNDLRSMDQTMDDYFSFFCRMSEYIAQEARARRNKQSEGENESQTNNRFVTNDHAHTFMGMKFGEKKEEKALAMWEELIIFSDVYFLSHAVKKEEKEEYMQLRARELCEWGLCGHKSREEWEKNIRFALSFLDIMPLRDRLLITCLRAPLFEQCEQEAHDAYFWSSCDDDKLDLRMEEAKHVVPDTLLIRHRIAFLSALLALHQSRAHIHGILSYLWWWIEENPSAYRQAIEALECDGELRIARIMFHILRLNIPPMWRKEFPFDNFRSKG